MLSYMTDSKDGTLTMNEPNSNSNSNSASLNNDINMNPAITDGNLDLPIKRKSNLEIPAINPIPNIVIPQTKEEIRALKEEALDRWRIRKNKMLEDEKRRLKPTQTLSCPECHHIIKISHNFFSNGFKCYNCGLKNFKPVLREKDYFEKILGMNKKKETKFSVDKDGQIIKERITTEKPIKLWHRRKYSDRDLMSREQILEFLHAKYDDVYKLNVKDIRNAALICFLFESGCRIEEI